MSKVNVITGKIKELITCNEFADGKLPGERELAISLGCGRNTVRAALAQLAEDGLIERCRKRGTIVKSSTKNQDKGLAGFIMRTSGHFFENVYHELLTSFIAKGYSVQSVSTNPVVDSVYIPSEENKIVVKSAIKKLLDAKPKIIVVDGYQSRRIPYFEELCARGAILINYCESCSEIKTHGVLFDYEKAGCLAGKYLLEQGCKHPIFFPNYLPLSSRLNSVYYSHHKDKMLSDGFRKAMIQGGIDPETSIINCFSNSLKDHMRILDDLSLLESNRIDGIFSYDVNISLYIKKLLENQRHIPENMSFVGLYNTPWSAEQSLFPFSSVCFDLAVTAAEIVKMAETPMEKRKDIYISPKIITRERNKKIKIG